MNRTPEGPWKQWTISVQKVCYPPRNGGVVGQIKWTGEHTLSSDILVPDHVDTCTPAKQVYTWFVVENPANEVCRAWLQRLAHGWAERARAWQPTGGHPVVVQSDQLGGQTADRYSSLGDCGSVHEPWRVQCRPSEIVESNAAGVSGNSKQKRCGWRERWRWVYKITVQNNTSVREKENTTSTACELIMLVLSISVTFSVTCLTVASNDGQYILVYFTR